MNKKKRESLLVYVPKEDKFLSVRYGTGCNLTHEDIENGYDSYLYISIHVFNEDDNEFENDVDGGELLYKSSEETYDNDISTAAQAAVDFMFGEQTIYIPMIPEVFLDSKSNYFKNKIS